LLLLFGLNIISSAATLAQPYFTKLIIDDAWLRRDTRNLWILAFWITFSAALSIVLGMAVTQVYIRLSAKVLFEMRLDAFRKIQSLSPQYFARTKTGDIVSRINNDIGELQRLSSDTLLSIASNVLFLVGSAVLMLWLNARLFVFSLAAVPFSIWAMRRYQGRLRSQIGRIREQSASIGSFLIESILGMRVAEDFVSGGIAARSASNTIDRGVVSLWRLYGDRRHSVDRISGGVCRVPRPPAIASRQPDGDLLWFDHGFGVAGACVRTARYTGRSVRGA
jgi:ATP-binding cassette subfamily B protein